TSSDSLTVAFSADETAEFFCARDGSPESSCTSPIVYESLNEGEHRLQIRARDVAGNLSTTPAEYIWIVDRTAPTTTITAADPSGAIINVTAVQLHFESSEAATFECRVDAAAYAGCVSPMTFSDLAEGAHTIDVRAIDLAGNMSLVATHAVSVDTSAPGVTITSLNPSITNQQTRSISFSSSESGSTFECALDAAAFSSCTSPISYSVLAEGTHSFRVRARDVAGNLSADVAQENWLIDLTAPETTITSRTPSGSPTESTSILFEFVSNEVNSRFECQRDAEPFLPCASPFVLNNLADGPHVFRVRAIDEAGNMDATAAQYDWVVNTAPLAIVTFSVSNITRTSARVLWQTNHASSSRVEVTHVQTGVVTVFDDPALVTTHDVTISGLTANTLYSIVAVSTTAGGQTVRSNAISIRTAR
ncbi:MAG: hypothetical protein NDI61_14655, partial [Bdellovibrionaceae bacterium]|nr:hypothetical protein [Pseudobdellovibrionaceae bacterium]